MSSVYKKHKEYIKLFGLFLILLILISILNCVFLPINFSKWIIVLLTNTLFFIVSFKEGKKRTNKGYLAGLKTSILGIIFFFLINIIFIHEEINFKNYIYYLIFILINIYGSILGINKKAS